MVKIFNDNELELLISGLPEIDIDDLRANTEYAGYTAASQTIQWFWKIVREMSKQELALLVQFVTGTSKVPLEGFKALQVITVVSLLDCLLPLHKFKKKLKAVDVCILYLKAWSRNSLLGWSYCNGVQGFELI